MTEPVTEPVDVDVPTVIPAERPVPDRLPFAIAPMETWIHAEVAALGVLPALVDWLMVNGIARPAEHREILVEPSAITYYRHGSDPLPGDRTSWVGNWRDGGHIVQVPDRVYAVRIVRQPPSGLFGRLAADGLLLCVSTGTAFQPKTMSGKNLRCRVPVDAHGRHEGDHRDELAEFGPEKRPLVWANLHPAKSIVRPQMDAASQVLHDGGAMAALAVLEEKLLALPFSNVGGLPTVEREQLFMALTDAAKELLGDTWATDVRAACEALKAQRSGSGG